MKKYLFSLASILWLASMFFVNSCDTNVYEEEPYCDKPTAIGGTVMDGSTGQAMSGASVSFFIPSGYFVKKYKTLQSTATTDASGNWSLVGIPPEIEIRLTFTKSGYKTYEVDMTTPECKMFTNVSTALYANFTMDEDPTNMIQGYVLDGTTGSPISGATASVQIGSGVKIDATTDASGYWVAAGLPANSDFEVVFSKTAYTGLSRVVTTGSNHSRVIEDVELFSYFTMDENPNNVMEGHVLDGLTQIAIAGVAVSLKIDSDTKIDTVTDANGYWTIAGLPSRDYKISFTKTNYATLIKTINLNASLQVEDADLYQYFTENDNPWYTVSGTLQDSSTGLKIAGAAIHLEYRQGLVKIDGTSDSQGEFNINGLPNLPHDITISKTGYRSLSGTDQNTNSYGIINMNVPATLKVEVADQDGAPLASARVIAIPTSCSLCDTGADVTADANGNASLTLSLQGHYDLIALNSGVTREGIYSNAWVQYPTTYVGIACGLILGVDSSLNLISSNSGEDSSGAVLKLVFDQPVKVTSVSGNCSEYFNTDYDGLAADHTGTNTGATASTATFGAYQVVITPKLTSTSAPFETNDSCNYSYQVESTAVIGATYMGGGSVTIP